MTLNGRFGWKIRKDLSLELEAFNITNRRDSAIDYYYESQLKGESAPSPTSTSTPSNPAPARHAGQELLAGKGKSRPSRA
jgi:hypothetical protein